MPLEEEARTSIQQSVDEIYDQFVSAVARNRGVNPASVRDGFGEGRTVSAQQAVKLGMADRIGTLDQVINELLGRTQAPAKMQAKQVNDQGKADSSDPSRADFEREAQALREYVNLYKS
jgi:ClpP class serine protease